MCGFVWNQAPCHHGALRLNVPYKAASCVIQECLWKLWSKLRPLSVSAERDKDILTDDKSTEYMPKLIDYLSDKGFDLIGHSRNQEKVADSAIDEGERCSSSQWDAAPPLSWLAALCFLVLFCCNTNSPLQQPCHWKGCWLAASVCPMTCSWMNWSWRKKQRGSNKIQTVISQQVRFNVLLCFYFSNWLSEAIMIVLTVYFDIHLFWLTHRLCMYVYVHIYMYVCMDGWMYFLLSIYLETMPTLHSFF